MEHLFLALLVIIMIGALASGFPVAFALPGSAIISIGLAAFFGYLFAGDSSAYFAVDGPKEWLTAGITNFRSNYWDVETDTLIAIPLFIFMGIMLQKSKIAEDLLVTMGQLFGPIPGGLGISVIFVGALLAATTGIVGATVIAMGLISLPTMLNNKYDKSLASGIVCSSGTLGQIIPPSIVLIIIADQLASAADVANTMRQTDYKILTGEFNMPGEFRVGSTSAGDMFLGALLPGLVLVGLYMLYVFVYARLNPKAAPPVPFRGNFDSKFWIKVLMVIIPPLALIFAVLGSILLGIATVNQAGSIGAIGATMMAGYRLHKGKKDAYYPIIIAIISVIPIYILSKNYNLNIKAVETRDLGAIFIAGFFTITFVIGIIWSFWRAYKIDNVLREVVTETCVTTSMVFIILLGAAMLTSGFRAFGGEELVRDFLQDLPGGFWTQFIVVMAVIFLLGFFLDFIEIAVVVVPIIAPILLAEPGANVSAIWLGVMIGVNLQTSFLTPPFGFALFYLKGVASKLVSTLNIWKGVVPFIVLQLIGLGIVGFYPSLVNYLPARTYLTSNVAPPPMNPKLQYCLQEYKFAIYNNEEQKITNAIKDMQKLTPSNLPTDKLDIFEEHFDNALGTFAIVKKLQKTEEEYEIFIKDYRDLHFDVRKIQKKIRKIDEKIKKTKSEIRNLDDDNLADKNKLELKIENYELEITELENKIPENWTTRNAEFEILHKAKNTRTKRYRKNVDEAYETLDQIMMFINDNEKLKELSPEIKELKYNIDNKNYENAISIIDGLFEKLGEISGTEEFANKLDDLISVIDNDEIDQQKLIEASSETFNLFNLEVSWRDDANKNLLPKLIKYNDVIKHNIGLRLQSRLTKEQAKFVARCNSVHRDISLNF
ncbi:TRAP transporter large permease subunit [Candidatus Pelagibacter sp. HIMB1485]|uniref:TRAP transporter large permease n=1 Tax=Candidatus Pelagibacter sp. HIMB1485 TaxID=3415415 RepID=UPI003F82C240